VISAHAPPCPPPSPPLCCWRDRARSGPRRPESRRVRLSPITEGTVTIYGAYQSGITLTAKRDSLRKRHSASSPNARRPLPNPDLSVGFQHGFLFRVRPLPSGRGRLRIDVYFRIPSATESRGAKTDNGRAWFTRQNTGVRATSVLERDHQRVQGRGPQNIALEYCLRGSNATDVQARCCNWQEEESPTFRSS